VTASSPLRVAAWSPGANHDEARAYVQARLMLFSKLWFWLFWVLVAVIEGMYRLYPATRPGGVAFVFEMALIGQLAFAAIWYFALHRRRVPLAWLYRIDAFYLMVIGIELGNSAYVQSDLHAAVYVALIWHTLVVFARTVIVPSSGARTFAVTGASFLLLLIGGAGIAIEHPERLDLPALPFMLGGTFLSCVAILLATTGSRVIFGLRRQVREAMQLGQYTLEEKIGEGGMGSVYRARHALLRRPTAIKLLPPNRVDARSLARFEREVQNMSRLTHPNSVAVYDYGRSLDGLFYYAMEYLDGVDLETLVRIDGPQPAPRVIRILRQICGALDEAHALGIIHRDIKPANVLLCRRIRQADVAKVVDFGLVKEITAANDDRTGTRVIVGTPAYLSPEAITDPAAVGPQSDLYAVGALGYYLLTGHPVFDGNTALHVCTLHVTATPVPPSLRTPHRPIPADLEALILACLAKDPAARPAGADGLRLALDALPAAHDWDEAAAAAWWQGFDARRPRRPAGPAHATVSFTVTRELDPTDVDVRVRM
jgi:eukaryotic-like serine/threonine-protein kinase